MQLSEQDKKTLVALATKTVAAVTKGEKLPAADPTDGILAQTLGCFVTITNSGRLRGCIGTFNPQAPLATMIVEMARSATKDPRFVTDPITAAELDKLKIEVSLLSPLTPIENPLDIEIGTHGIYILRDGRGGCFLPEVATDQGWDKEQFLSYCCSHKAGLPADAWKDEKTKVLTFTSVKFS